MAAVAPHVPTEEANRLLRESEKLRAESAALRPKTRWLTQQLDRILAENHLSDRIRHALGD
jgi:hypothetical protein